MAVLFPGTASGQLAPAIDKPYRYILVEERRDERGLQRFQSDRRLIFHSRADGFALDMTILTANGPANGPGGMFATAMAGLKGRPIRFLLDSSGRIIGVEDQLGTWAALCKAIDRGAKAAPSGSAARNRAAHNMAATFRALPSDRQLAFLASMVSPALAGSLATRVAVEDAAVTIPARSATGAPIMMAGRETIRWIDDKTISIVTTAAGEVATAGPTPPAPARISVTLNKRIDRGAGLIVDSREERETTIGSGPGLRRSSSTTISRIEFVVS